MLRILSIIAAYIITLFPNIMYGHSTGLLFKVSATNNQLSISTVKPNYRYPQAGIKINTSGYSIENIGTECTPNANGYCIFSVSDTTPATISILGATGLVDISLCLKGSVPLSCQHYNIAISSTPPIVIQRHAYITNNSGAGTPLDPTVSLCDIDVTSGAITACLDAGGGSAMDNIFSQGIVINSSGTQAFINSQDNGNNNIYQCPINQIDHSFNGCTAVPITSPSGYYASYGFLTLNPSNTLAYLVDGQNSRILACPIVSDVLSGTCTDTGATNIDADIVGIVLNKQGSTAYMASYTGHFVTVCAVNGTVFSGCVQHTGGGAVTFTSPAGLALNNTESLLYVTDYSGPGQVYACRPDFSNCTLAANIVGAYGIALNAANTFALVTNYTNTYSCSINNDGTFSGCATGGSFSAPADVTYGP